MNVLLEDSGFRRSDQIRKLYSSPVVTVYSHNTIEQAAKRILQLKTRRMPVVNDKNFLEGIVTSVDILTALANGESIKSSVSKIMVKNVFTCSVDDTIDTVFQKLKIGKRGGLPVMNKNKPVGMVTERDFVKNFANVVFKTAVDQIMIQRPMVLKITHTMYDALRLTATARLRRFPVLDGNRVVGITTSHDILSNLVQNNFDINALKVPLVTMMRTVIAKTNKSSDISDAIKTMNNLDVGGLVVVDTDANLQGIITDRDILKLIY